MESFNDVFGFQLGGVFDFDNIPDRIKAPKTTIYQYRESGDLFRVYYVWPKDTFYNFDTYSLLVNTSMGNKTGAIEAFKILKTEDSFYKEGNIAGEKVFAYLKDRCKSNPVTYESGDSDVVVFTDKHHANRFYRLSLVLPDKNITFSFMDYSITKNWAEENHGIVQSPVTESI